MKQQKQIANLWIKNYESKKDIFRTKYLEPYLKKIIQSLPKNSKILDVGCGWGMVANFIRKDQEYIGIDINKEFFPYILKNNKKKKIKLIWGKLPNKMKVKENYFDLVICSLVLHVLPNLNKSVNKIISKSKHKIVIVDFNDTKAKITLLSGFPNIKKKTKRYIKGVTKLPSGIHVPAQVYFHKEEEYEKEIKKYAKFRKRKVGPIFISYEITKSL